MRSILPWAVLLMSGWFELPGSAARPGYLPTVGPVPLRYLESRTKSALVALPPLYPPENPEEAAASKPPLEKEAPPATEPTEPVAPPVTTTRQETLPTPVQPPATPLSPQLLIRYFATPDSTNRAVPVVIAPVGFVPPTVNTPPPSSRATYSTGP